MKKIIVAIDGYSSCGKSTMAKSLARRVGYIYVDTGAMYRAVTLFALRQGLFSDKSIDAEGLQAMLPDVSISFRLDPAPQQPHTLLNGADVEEEIRTMEVSSRVSQVATLPFVRKTLVALQQAMGTEKGIVMDGRDVGTAVFPQAELKIFVTASPEVRARRRYDEMRNKGLAADYDEILKNVSERDYIDTHREVDPLRKAPDAFELDNGQLSIAEQDAWLMERFEQATR